MKKLVITNLIAMVSLFAFAQNENEIVMKAMKSEMQRNIEQLKLENLKNPFYIAYTAGDIELTYIGASLGSITGYSNDKLRTQNTNLLVGDYQRTNNNFFDANVLYRWGSRISVPVDNDYYGIRRTFWKSSDEEYKFAAEVYESKISAINNQNLSQEDLDLADFSKSKAITKKIPENNTEIDVDKWKNIAKDVSAVFIEYDNIIDSDVSLYFYNTYVNFYNSEKSEISYPLTYAVILITAETLSESGERLFDHIHYYATSPDDLPDLKKLKKDAEFTAEKLTKLQNAPVFEDYYSGPVLIMEQAVPEYFIQQVFDGTNSLLARRRPILQNEQIGMAAGSRAKGNRLELRMNRRIMDRSITIKSNPLLQKYNNIKLFGHYPVDAEGVVPKETVLVKEGILNSFLTNRIPTKTSNESNGSERIAIQNKNFGERIAPGVIFASSTNTKTEDELKKELIRIAKDEDMDYAIIIRKFEYPVSERTHETRSWQEPEETKMTRPLYIYKVNLEDGSEELIRGAEVSGLNIRSLNRIIGTSEKEYVYNGMKSVYHQMSNKGFFHGIPVSIICPDAILFREVEIQQETSSKRRLPVVDSPLKE